MSERKLSEAGSSKVPVPPASFPMHNSPRVWFITSALSPIAVRLIRMLLSHGDYIAAGLPSNEIDDDARSAEFRELINECKSDRKDREGWKDRIRGIRCDGRIMGQCGAAVAEAVEVFERIDILLCCTSEAVVGTVEELSTSPLTENLVRDQFETIYFGQVNFIKATLPLLREKHTGHIIILTGISGHIGTPGMPMYCASIWALEGYCDSLAYEIAPFNIKLTIVQPNKEVQLLSNRIIFCPPLSQYDSKNNPAPGLRDILTNVANMHPETRMCDSKGKPEQNTVVSLYPRISQESLDRLVLETVHALTAIGGHENPPSRHIVGFEGVAAVKEKLKTVSEELEDFVEVSCAVDIFKSDVSRAALSGVSKTDGGNVGSSGVMGRLSSD
ncbi:hypothetical protein OIDMADRAFT_59034 [Oidiodendron maius Zn]|uniref:Uncharacterized protein n=1 Tax=Oidiodendron maius (strain Zn) TaxID=913774 RepID=A0A0C3CAI5_OIDMZ|nr:hypothetical protein OIDMADRAFT_59034 [Oidiodendron maius Zn]